MPELPEVETIKEDLRGLVVGSEIGPEGPQRAAYREENRVNAEEFLGRLKREVIGHPSLSHPFLERFAEDEGGQRRVREGAMRSLDARSVMLDGLYRVVYKEPVPTIEVPQVRLTGG
ncbi:MAG TPA: hypothetical protein VFY59_11525 [Rubrobacter sp.]|nr:hypothetical protein [Rubrobacter sp.]